MTVYECEHLWRGDGWLSPAYVAVDASGFVTSVGEAPPSVRSQRIAGLVIPGMPNLHSHAFQRAMAGLSERASAGSDSFWSWRETMYGFVERLRPDDVEAIAAELYMEMLEAGYTSVGEFHYLHHAENGEPYANPAEMSERLIAAAHRAGIGITLLPVLYQTSGFGGAELLPPQRRFSSSVGWLVSLIERLAGAWRNDPEVTIGVAPHSLRAVPPAALAECLGAVRKIDARAPVHLHVAEQQREVDECRQWCGKRPVEWLLDNVAVDGRYTLIHATHVSGEEISGIAERDAVVGLCPTTEANLGDGIAPATELLAAGVTIGIGSDSNVSIDVSEELRWLEYGQRLRHGSRNALATPRQPGTGAWLYGAALGGGARALARPIGFVNAGARADWVVLDPDHPTLARRPIDRVLDALVFSNQGRAVRDVMVGGHWVVRGGVHRDREAIRNDYRRALVRLS